MKNVFKLLIFFCAMLVLSGAFGQSVYLGNGVWGNKNEVIIPASGCTCTLDNVIHNGNIATAGFTITDGTIETAYRFDGITANTLTGDELYSFGLMGYYPTMKLTDRASGYSFYLQAQNLSTPVSVSTPVNSGIMVAAIHGIGSPETVITANIGTMYINDLGGAGVTLWIKESGTGNTGWVNK
jgi:hypothetical protein